MSPLQNEKQEKRTKKKKKKKECSHWGLNPRPMAY
jgi:hypothetical protein